MTVEAVDVELVLLVLLTEGAAEAPLETGAAADCEVDMRNLKD